MGQKHRRNNISTHKKLFTKNVLTPNETVHYKDDKHDIQTAMIKETHLKLINSQHENEIDLRSRSI